MSPMQTVYQMKVTLIGSEPPIWRRFLVAHTTSLYRLHTILQDVMGWQDCHLHMFTIDGQIYGDPEDDEEGELGTQDEIRFKLKQLVMKQGSKFLYEYDFGDSWDHELIVEKILLVEQRLRYPLCVAGQRHCPPEDVGGLGGYDRFLEAIADPKHPEHDGYLTWAGGKFDPEYFDLQNVNRRLHRSPQSWEAEAERYQPPQLDPRVLEKISSWARGRSEEQTTLAGNIAVRRDMATLLCYFREKRPLGTQSTGNLQLKAVRDVCAQFTDPPELEGIIGGYHYQAHSEAEVWQLYYLHRLAVTGRLVTGGRARTWGLTPTGKAFLNYSAPIQLGMMLSIWWYLEDWTIAFPVDRRDSDVPQSFRKAVLACLLALEAGKWILYEPFADEMALRGGFTVSGADQAFARRTLRTAMKRMVIERLAEFGCLECEYLQKTREDFWPKELVELRLTSFGQELLGIL
jgi:hypothetical protein